LCDIRRVYLQNSDTIFFIIYTLCQVNLRRIIAKAKSTYRKGRKPDNYSYGSTISPSVDYLDSLGNSALKSAFENPYETLAKLVKSKSLSAYLRQKEQKRSQTSRRKLIMNVTARQAIREVGLKKGLERVKKGGKQTRRR
jgi:hypothetical protein